MGNVIDFPVEQRLLARPVNAGADATVIILPVVRVERSPDLPSDGVEPRSGAASSRKRRRRRA
jgi:hypothetical protein